MHNPNKNIDEAHSIHIALLRCENSLHTGCSLGDVVPLCTTITYCLVPFPSFQKCLRHVFCVLLPMVAKRCLQIKGHLVQLHFRFPQLLMFCEDFVSVSTRSVIETIDVPSNIFYFQHNWFKQRILLLFEVEQSRKPTACIITSTQ